MAVLTRTGEQIIGQLSSPDGSLLEEKLDTLAQRWRAVNRQVADRQRRYNVDKNTQDVTSHDYLLTVALCRWKGANAFAVWC